jgi:iron complex outermembrane receptor protein
MKPRRWLVLALATSVVASASAATAADQASDPSTAQIETVVVTGQKRNEDVQKVDIAIAAYNPLELQRRGASDLQSVVENEPNMKVFDQLGGGMPFLIIRGVGVQDFRVNTAPAASLYVDDVYQSTVMAAAFPMFDIQDLEVLKGPQGGLYGRNTAAGAASLVSQPAQTGHFGAGVTAGFGSFDTASAEGFVNIPAGDAIAVRIAGFTEQGQGGPWYSATGRFHSGAPDRTAGRVSITWKPDEAWDLRVQVHGGRDGSSLPLPRPVGIWADLGPTLVDGYANGALYNYLRVAPGPASVCGAFFSGRRDDSGCQALNGLSPAAMDLGTGQDFTSAGPTRNRLDVGWIGAVADLKYRLGDVTLQSIAAYDRLDDRRTVQWDGVPVPQALVLSHTKAVSQSLEVRLFYDRGPLDLILGASYGREELKNVDDLVGYAGVLPILFGSDALRQTYSEPTVSTAGYGHAEYRFNSKLKLTGEFRFTDEAKSHDEQIVILSGAPGGPVDPVALFAPYPPTATSLDSRMPTGKLAVDYAPTAGLTMYASASHGAKSGGFATSAAETRPYLPETVTAIETGFKGDWFGRTLRIDASVFHYDENQFQASATHSANLGAAIGMTNVGRVRDDGLELQVQWLPTERWRLDAQLGAMDATIVKSSYLAADAFQVSSAGPAALHPLQGANIPNYSKFSGRLGVTYAWDLPTGDKADIALGYAYRSTQDLSLIVYAPEAAVYREPGYGLADLRLGLHDPRRGWAVFCFVENLTDTRYRTSAAIDGLGGMFEIYGKPRTWGLRLQGTF